MHVLKVAFLKFGLKSFIPRKNCSAVFAPRGLLDELLNKLSYPCPGRHMDFISRDPSCCSFHAPGNFLPPWCPALKMTAPLQSSGSFYFSVIIQTLKSEN